MNTPAHAIINLLILKAPDAPKKNMAIVVGAVLPDIIMIGFYIWHRLIGTPEHTIWNHEYYRPVWQGFFDIFNSVPLITLAMVAAWKYNKPILLALLISMLLHAVGGFPVHADDAHRHFFPFSDWRYVSPISYWDPDRFGDLAGIVEAVITIAIAAFLIAKVPACRNLTIALLLIYIAYQFYVFIVWR